MHRTTLFLALVNIVACLAHAEPDSKSENPNEKPPHFLIGVQVEKLISGRLDEGKTCVFHSRDGKFYGMDSDSVVSFEKERGAVVGEHGFAYQGYRGTYNVTKDGVISVALKGYRGNWPEMKLAKEGDLIRLYANDGKGNFVFGGRAGAVETEEMKPFWPFRLVETELSPGVTPIYTGGELKTFECPQIPDDFEWKGDLIRFRLDVDISKEGIPVVQKYWSQDGEKIENVVGQFANGDWRLPVVASAKATLEQWEFYPEKADGMPVPTNGFWHFDISLVDGMVRWVIVDNAVTVFDSMPRRRDE